MTLRTYEISLLSGKFVGVMFLRLKHFFGEKFRQIEKRVAFDQQKHSIDFEISNFKLPINVI